MKYLMVIFSLLVLSGCDAMQQNGARAGHNIRKSYDATRYKISRYIHGEKPQEQQASNLPPAPPIFCYEVRSDVLCYDRPKPEMHLNLVAAHGENNYSYEDFLPENVKQQEGVQNLSMHSSPMQNAQMGYNNYGAQTSYGAEKVGKDISVRNLSPNIPFHNSPSPSAKP